MRTMVATVSLTGVLVATLGLAAVTTATAQDDGEAPEATGVAPDVLVDRLVELERQLPPLPPSAVEVAEEETFGDVRGDFLGAETELSLIEDEARQLFADADDTDGEVADAVSSVARSYLRMQEAFDYLARYRDHDLSLPTERTDDGVSTGADTAATFAEAGLDVLELARMDALAGYGLLRDSEAADDTEKELFDAAYRDTQQYLTVMRPEARRLVSASTTAVLLAVERFEDATATQGRAQDVEYVCIPREHYPFDSPDPVASLAEAVQADAVELLPTADCPDLPSPANEVVVGS